MPPSEQKLPAFARSQSLPLKGNVLNSLQTEIDPNLQFKKVESAKNIMTRNMKSFHKLKQQEAENKCVTLESYSNLEKPLAQLDGTVLPLDKAHKMLLKSTISRIEIDPDTRKIKGFHFMK